MSVMNYPFKFISLIAAYFSSFSRSCWSLILAFTCLAFLLSLMSCTISWYSPNITLSISLTKILTKSAWQVHALQNRSTTWGWKAPLEVMRSDSPAWVESPRAGWWGWGWYQPWSCEARQPGTGNSAAVLVCPSHLGVKKHCGKLS